MYNLKQTVHEITIIVDDLYYKILIYTCSVLLLQQTGFENNNKVTYSLCIIVYTLE